MSKYMQKKVEISKLFWPKVMHFLSDAQYFLYKNKMKIPSVFFDGNIQI